METKTKPAEECMETYGRAVFALYRLLEDGRQDLFDLAIATAKRVYGEEPR